MSTVVTGRDPGLAEYLDRPVTMPPNEVARHLARSCDPSRVLRLHEMDRLLDPAPLDVENGWCHLDDGSAFVGVRTEMPGVTAEMVDWWFDWHPRKPDRYRVWHPSAHRGNRLEPAGIAGAKPFWGTVHHAVEDVGTGTIHARINFQPPTSIGFSTDALDDERVGTIACAFVGDRLARHTIMAHVFLNSGGGLTLRSHFWIGASVRPNLPPSLLRVAEPLVNRAAVRRLMMPRGVPENLARHCAEEYTNLAAILPPIYEQYAKGDLNDT